MPSRCVSSPVGALWAWGALVMNRETSQDEAQGMCTTRAREPICEERPPLLTALTVCSLLREFGGFFHINSNP